jgi:hypothetical protein
MAPGLEQITDGEAATKASTGIDLLRMASAGPDVRRPILGLGYNLS